MSELGKIIALSNEDKELYTKLDFKYFLEQNILKGNLSQENIQLIHVGYSNTLEKIAFDKYKNKTQYHLFIEGYIRKMHSGGLLAAHFNLSEARSLSILRFEEYGENWAYFEQWAKREKCLRYRKNLWKYIIEAGSIIGLLLGAIELYKLI